MIHRPSSLILFTIYLAIGSLNIGITPAFAEQKVNTGNMQGTVKNIIDVTSYTYVEVETENTTVWVAAPTTKINVGSTITFSTEMPMQDFHSDSMNKTFPLIYFVSRFINDADKTPPSNISSSHTQNKPTGPILKGIEKIKDGKNIAEIYAERDSLKGKKVKIRGKVIRFSTEIMGKNWIHILDSSSANDLTVTTNEIVTTGDVVIIEGKVGVDKDFGYGYLYPIILEEATLLQNK